jgi:hypothetical protein
MLGDSTDNLGLMVVPLATMYGRGRQTDLVSRGLDWAVAAFTPRATGPTSDYAPQPVNLSEWANASETLHEHKSIRRSAYRRPLMACGRDQAPWKMDVLLEESWREGSPRSCSRKCVCPV